MLKLTFTLLLLSLLIVMIMGEKLNMDGVLKSVVKNLPKGAKYRFDHVETHVHDKSGNEVVEYLDGTYEYQGDEIVEVD